MTHPAYTFREWFVGTFPKLPTPSNGHSVWPPEIIPHEEPHEESALRLFACEIGEGGTGARVCNRQNVWLEAHVMDDARRRCMRCGWMR